MSERVCLLLLLAVAASLWTACGGRPTGDGAALPTPEAAPRPVASARTGEVPAARSAARTAVPSAAGEPLSGPPASQSGVSQETGADASAADVLIRYTGDEFVPKRAEAKVGQSVGFVNAFGSDFWSASNIHPTHEVYPGFDAEKPIPPGDTWVFTFDQEGFWRYHNHLSPSNGGLVVVSGDGLERDKAPPLPIGSADVNFSVLGAVSPEDGINLFRDDALLERFVEEYGPAETVRLLSEYEHLLNVDCHQRAHDMGRVAYKLFGALAFSLSGHECHSGGYHGATEALFRERGTANLQGDLEVICDESPNGFFRHQCVHGIGHGLMAWTNYEMLDALELCDAVETGRDQRSCYSGVFMENVVGGLSGSMGHFSGYLSDDPHFPCNILGEEYVASCYFYQTSRMVQLFNGDFEQLAAACAEAPQSAHRECFESMGRDVGGVTRGNPARAIEFCSFVDKPDYRTYCLEGAVQDSFWDEGGADNALAFCQMLYEEAEKTACYRKIVTRAHDIYTAQADLETFCARVEEGYRERCP